MLAFPARSRAVHPRRCLRRSSPMWYTTRTTTASSGAASPLPPRATAQKSTWSNPPSPSTSPATSISASTTAAQPPHPYFRRPDRHHHTLRSRSRLRLLSLRPHDGRYGRLLTKNTAMGIKGSSVKRIRQQDGMSSIYGCTIQELVAG